MTLEVAAATGTKDNNPELHTEQTESPGSTVCDDQTSKPSCTPDRGKFNFNIISHY